MRILQFLSLCAIVSLLFSSCSSGAESVSLIPEEASIVFSVNVKSLADKAEFEDWGEFEFMKAAENELKSESKALADLLEEFRDNPASAGMDLREDAYIFTASQGKRSVYTAVVFDVLDDDDFEEFIIKALDATEMPFVQGELEDYKNFLIRERMMLSYDSDRAVMIIPMGYMEADELADVTEYLVTMDNKDRLTQEESFNAFIETSNDVGVWGSTGSIMEMMGSRGDIRELEEALNFDPTDNSFMAHLDFDDEEIKLESTTFYGEDLQALIDDYDLLDKKMDSDLLDLLPGNALISTGLSVNLEGILEMLATEKQYKDIHRELQSSEELEKIINALRGEGVYAMYGVEKREITLDPDMYGLGGYGFDGQDNTFEVDVPLMAGVFGIDSEEAFEALVEEIGAETKKENGYYKAFDGTEAMYIGFNDDYVMSTNVLEYMTDFMEGDDPDASLLDSDEAAIMKGKNLFATIELNADRFPENIMESFRGDEREMAEMVDDLADHAELYMGTEDKINLTIHTHEGDGNSLYRIVKLMDELYKKNLSY